MIYVRMYIYMIMNTYYDISVDTVILIQMCKIYDVYYYMMHWSNTIRWNMSFIFLRFAIFQRHYPTVIVHASKCNYRILSICKISSYYVISYIINSHPGVVVDRIWKKHKKFSVTWEYLWTDHILSTSGLLYIYTYIYKYIHIHMYIWK